MRNDKSTTPSHLKKHWLLYGITATILIISLVGLAVAVLPNAQVKIQRDTLFVISAIYLLASCSFFLWIYLRNQDQEFVGVLPKVIDELKRIGREYFKNTSAIEDNSERVEKLHNRIEQEIKRLEESNNSFVESNKSIEKILMDLRQENGNLQRELLYWNQSTIEFFQVLKRALETEQNEEKQKVINKNIQDFEQVVNKRGFYRIVSFANGEFDENEHECKGEEQSSKTKPGYIVRCDRWGYRLGAKVLQRAEVILALKPINSNDSEQLMPLEASTTT
ncbi:nucleotide exchange factor GrpE [uncultured Nostoc sp.]|uniref:nucleotide exchange factor GrpE n=1 Tax=uncultured Nostoc sp. TaxID=340711 RepID=UPI00261C6C9E|nr:nucleotide exchange factor GrpE [uncultured Nostoc sp.]